MGEPDVEAAARDALRSFATVMGQRAEMLTELLVARSTELIAELPHDPGLVDLLAGSVGSNLETLTHLLRGHVPVDDVRAPAAAVEYARRLAQRGTPPGALLRAYRLGQQLVLAWAGDEIAGRVRDPRTALRTSQLLTETSFAYIDAVSEDVMGAYQGERERWLAHRSATRREVVEALLRGERRDAAHVEAALGYRLAQHHLGLLLWDDEATVAAAGAPEEAIARIVAHLGAGTPLVVPHDRGTWWAWLPVDAGADPRGLDLPAGSSLRVAAGRVAHGLDGLLATHRSAVATQRVAQVGQVPPGRLVSAADPTVRAAALLVGDLPATRALVADALGPLAADGDAAARLRETLLVFVQERESHVATAARLHLHRNTVKYRVDRAVALRGRPLAEDRLDLELALIACRHLAPAVLT
ncbi:PucR family transcriptional regulator [Nocardioides sp.]|uniref:PucR family transcriptional regulator n=1 Tax=Nocardioides sp. TaxID=35761 RepID=UPI0035119831